jgi:type IV pilus assembly protein PilN
MRLDINLATRPYEDSRQFWVRWGAGLGLLGVLTLVLLYFVATGIASARKDRVLITEREQQIAERDAQRTRAEATLNLPENRSTRDRSQFLNDLFQLKAFSWTRVFEDMERVMPNRLRVLSIQPTMSSGHQLELKLIVGGDTREHAQELVRRMEGSQHFQDTKIEIENTQMGGQGDPVHFEISATYVPESDTQIRKGGM